MLIRQLHIPNCGLHTTNAALLVRIEIIVVSVIKLNGTMPMKFSLRLNADDTYVTVKQQLSQRCSIPSYLLKLVQISGSNIKVKCDDRIRVFGIHDNVALISTIVLQMVLADDQKIKPIQSDCNMFYAYELPVSCNSSGSISGDEERLSITSIKSTQREAAQTFTAIQRLVRPGSQTNLGWWCSQFTFLFVQSEQN